MGSRALLVACLACACGRHGFSDQADGGNGGHGGDAIGDTSSSDTSTAIEPIALTIPVLSMTTTTFATIPGSDFTIPASPGRTWALFATASLDTTSLAEIGVEIQYVVDGVPRGIGGTQSSVVGKGGPWQHFYAIAGSATPIPVRFELRDAAGGTATVQQLHVVALPLPAGADPHFIADDPERLITTTAFTTTSTFQFTPASAGDYLIFTVVNASDAPSESDCYVQWRGPDAVLHQPDVQVPRTAWQSVLGVWKQTLTATPQSFTLESHVGSGMSRLQYARVLAFRTDAFAAAAFGEKLPYAMTTSSMVFDQLAAPAGGSQFFYLATLRMEEKCPASPSYADREARFAADGVNRTTTSHMASNCAYVATYGTVDLLQTKPTTLTTTLASGNGRTVLGSESAIVYLGLP